MLEREKTIGFKVRQLFNTIHRHGDQNSELFERQNISMLQRWIIGFLAHNRGKDIFQKDLEQRLKIGKSTLTETLHVMEKNGLVVRKACERDARCKTLVMTQKAESIHEEIELDIEEFEKKLRANITDEEMRVFFSVADRMLENAQN